MKQLSEQREKELQEELQRQAEERRQNMTAKEREAELRKEKEPEIEEAYKKWQAEQARKNPQNAENEKAMHSMRMTPENEEY